MRYKIEIDRVDCIACGLCYTIDQIHFETDRDGKSMVIGEETSEMYSSGVFEDGSIDVARDAENSCPVSVIKVTEL